GRIGVASTGRPRAAGDGSGAPSRTGSSSHSHGNRVRGVVLVEGEARPHRRRIAVRRPAVQAKFYARSTEEVARGLLGRILISDVGGRGQQTAGRIVEVEAYVGPQDPACHAFGHRRTARNEPIYCAHATSYAHVSYV